MSKLSRTKRLIGKTITLKGGAQVRVLEVLWVDEGAQLCEKDGQIVVHGAAEVKAAYDRIKNLEPQDRPEMWPGEKYIGGASSLGLYLRVEDLTTRVQALQKAPSRIRQKDLV